MKKRITAASAALLLLLACAVPAAALDDDEYSGYAADTLTIRVGYFGGTFYEKKVFTLDELNSMDIVERDYTFIDNMPSVVIDHVKGVRLADIIDAAGIDINSVQTFYFWTNDKTSSYYTDWSKKSLIDTTRYCYYSLPDNFDDETQEANEYAAAYAEAVPTVMALADDWNRTIAGATFGSDYVNLNTNTRFRLIFGQTNTYERTAQRSAKWVHAINVALGGAPSLTVDASVLEGKVGSVLRTEAAISAADSAIAAGMEGDIEWSSSDTSVATVDAEGNITIVGEGPATITARSGDLTASVTVNGSEEEGSPAGTGESGSGAGDGAGDTSGSESAVNLSETDALLSIKPAQSAVVSEGDTGGVQNWRVYEMDADSELGEIEKENPLTGFVGGALGCIFVVSGAAYAAGFRMQTGKGK